jgi:raffinose/stachyose/melibiose transport system substrate-binding protein
MQAFRMALTAGTVAFAALPAHSDATVTWLHIETNPAIVAAWEEIAAEFESQNVGVEVELQFLEAEAYKQKLTTLLQSDAKPDMFYSWGGGVFHEQARAGVLRDITEEIEGDFADSLSAASIGAVTYDGKVYGVPYKVEQVGFWYNKDLYAQAGVNAEEIRTWQDFLQAMQKLKDAGITPIALGAADLWPVHFYWANLAIRIGGRDALEAARLGEDGGFNNPVFVKAGEMLQELADMEPFQRGHISAKYGDAAAVFGNQEAATHFQGTWDYGRHRALSATKDGIPDEQLGWYAFPMVEGGAGQPTDTLGGINTWLVSAGADDATVDFLKFFTTKTTQENLAAQGYLIPIVKGAGTQIPNPFFAQIAENIGVSEYHQLFLDQDLGPDVGRAVNDASTAIVAGAMTPAEAASYIQDAMDASQ